MQIYMNKLLVHSAKKMQHRSGKTYFWSQFVKLNFENLLSSIHNKFAVKYP